MSNLNIAYEDIGFKAIGAGNNEPETVLESTIVIAGLTCHIEAYEVSTDGSGFVTAMNVHYAHCVEALRDLNGESLSTVEINGRDYVIAVYPYAR